MISRLAILILAFAFSAGGLAQSYVVEKNVSNVNGDPGPMNGVPGDLFATTITFSNTGSALIYLFMDRYQKSIPPYWYSCYCYIQCHDQYRDTISIELQPGGFADVTLQFKTDSVNPGVATSSFKVYQIGYENQVQTIHMTASTMGSTAFLRDRAKVGEIIIFPNPVADQLQILAPEAIREIRVLDLSGRLLEQLRVAGDRRQQLNTSGYGKGSYLIEVSTGEQLHRQRFEKY